MSTGPIFKMKNWQKKLLLSTTFVAVALSSTVQAKEWKTIRFGTESAYAPFEYKTQDNKLVGFDIDLGNAICAKLKAKCVWVENSFDGMIPALKAKKFDGILSSMTVTTDRAKQIAFSNKIYNTPTRMVAKKGSPLLPTPTSLKGKRVGVQQGTIQEIKTKVHKSRNHKAFLCRYLAYIVQQAPKHTPRGHKRNDQGILCHI